MRPRDVDVRSVSDTHYARASHSRLDSGLTSNYNIFVRFSGIASDERLLDYKTQFTLPTPRH